MDSSGGAAGTGGPSEQLTLAVATHLHKLMAYEDEYEVARLAVDPEFAAQITRDRGECAVAKLQPHPPALWAMAEAELRRVGPVSKDATWNGIALALA